MELDGCSYYEFDFCMKRVVCPSTAGLSIVDERGLSHRSCASLAVARIATFYCANE
jgi:hypothetical protein